MAQVGERAVAVITSQSVNGLGTMDARTPNAPLLDEARFIAQVLLAEGFEILNFHPIAISFAGAPEAFERVFGLHLQRRTFAGGRGRQVNGFDVAPEDAHRLSNLPPVFEARPGVMAIARPPRLIDDAGAPVRDVADADIPIWSLPDELAISIWAGGSEGATATGHGVVAAQIGTGHYRHRFFSDRGYRVLPTLLGPGQTHPQRDDHGHATGEAACLFSAAPDLRLRPIKGLIDPVGDLLMTAESAPKPDLIINSWGYDVDQLDWSELESADPNLFHYLKILEAAIRFANAAGVIVCAATPRTWKSFPACHPDVIAIAAASKGRAAERVSEGMSQSNLYSGRHVPDIWSDAAKSVRSGLDLIGCTHPAQPGSALAWSGRRNVMADEGFAWCDIEQAASPLAASRLALLLEQHPGLSPAGFRMMLTDQVTPLSADGLEAVQPDQTRIEASSQTVGAVSKLADENAGPTIHAGCAANTGLGSLAG